MRVEIRKATGGAHIDPDRDRVEVIIAANDFVAGVLRFAKTAYLVREGGHYTCLIILTGDWEILKRSCNTMGFFLYISTADKINEYAAKPLPPFVSFPRMLGRPS